MSTTNTHSNKLVTLDLICSILQIIGLILITLLQWLPHFTIVLIGIAGFAGFVRYFLPIRREGFEKDLLLPAAICGVILVIMACVI